MSLDLTAEREWVAEILSELDLANVFPYLPASTALPAFLILPTSPYVQAGQTFGAFRIAFRVVFISRNGANATETDAVDSALSATVNAFIEQGISIDGASAPYSINLNNGTFLAADLNISYISATS